VKLVSRSTLAPYAASSAVTCAVVSLALLGGCSSTSAPTSAPPSSVGSADSTASSVTGKITVLAAASLNEAFTTLGKDFEAAHPGTSVALSFGPSSGLAQQIVNGAPADVFASASPKNMAQVVAAGDAANPATFALNKLEIAVPAANPAQIGQLADLAKPGVKVAMCGPDVPAGALAAAAFTKAHITVKPVTQEVDVKAVLSKVTLGEVDAGLVYVTDVRAAGDKVKGIALPASVNASTSYPIATVAKSANPNTANAFMAYVLSDKGAAVLASDGFASP